MNSIYITSASVHLPTSIKVLQIISSELGDFRFNAFTLGRDSSWRPSQVDPVGDGCHLFEISVVARSFGSVRVNGAIHYWFDGMKKTIVVFDVREEIFRVVPLAEDFAQELGDYNFKISSSWQAGRIFRVVPLSKGNAIAGYSFGFCPLTNEYKLLHFFTSWEPGKMHYRWNVKRIHAR